MEIPNLDFWAKEWPLIRDAPHLFFGGILAVGLIIWLFVRWVHKEHFDGLREQINAREARLQLAAEKVAWANQAKDEVEGQFQTYKAQVAANSGYASLAATAAKIDAALDKLSAANKAVSNAIGLIGIPTGEAFGTPSIRLDNE
jgi:hypothetical protein